MRDLDHALTLIEATVGAVARAGDAEDAARLGRRSHQRAGACAPRRGGRRPHDHRARPHALPVLQGRGRLGRGPRRQGRRLHPGRRQRRHPHLRRCRRRARRVRRRRRHDRARARRAGPGCPARSRAISQTGRREAAPPLAHAVRADRRRSTTRCSTHHGLRIGLKHARKHLGWALDAAAATAGVAVDTLKRWRGTRADRREPRLTSRSRLARSLRRLRLRERGGMSDARPAHRRVPHGAADAVLNALPQPVIIVAADGRIADANVAAEAFFEASVLLLRRQMLRDLVPFGSPLLALVEQVRSRGAAVNEYRVDLGDAAQSGRAAGRPLRRAAAGAARPRRGDAAGAHHRRQDGPPAHPSRRRALGDRRSPRCWRTRSRTRCPASAARRSCSSSRPATTTAR